MKRSAPCSINCARAESRTCWPLRGDPPKGETAFVRVRGRLRLCLGVDRVHSFRLGLLLGGGLLPGVPPRVGVARVGSGERQVQGRRGHRALGHAAVLQQSGLLCVRGARPRRGHLGADHRWHHADHERVAGQALHGVVRRGDPPRRSCSVWKPPVPTPRRCKRSAWSTPQRSAASSWMAAPRASISIR